MNADQRRIIPHGSCFRGFIISVVNQLDPVQPIQDRLTDVVSADIEDGLGQGGNFSFRKYVVEQCQNGDHENCRQYHQTQMFFAFHFLKLLAVLRFY